jgi:hypothetical protein
MALKDWSTTAASNASVTDASLGDINWAEGQAPSTVNDSARIEMAHVRDWYDTMEWRDWGHTITYGSATTFTTAAGDGDTTSVYLAGRRIRAVGATTGTIYGRITTSSHSSTTTVTVVWDSGNLENEALTISVGSAPTGGAFMSDVAGTLRPDSDGGQDLGTTSVRWGNLYVDNIGDTGQTMTVTGSVNFDSNTLFVDHSNNRAGIGTASPSAPLHVYDTAAATRNVLVELADNGALSGPYVALFRESTSPASSDIIGLLSWDGRDSANNYENYAQVYTTIADATTTTEDATMYHFVQTGGTLTNTLAVAFDRVGSAKDVYIGSATTTPSAPLHVYDTADGDTVIIEVAEAGAIGAPTLVLWRNSSSPAASDAIGTIAFSGEDSAGNKDRYAALQAEIVDPTTTSEDGRLGIWSMEAGTLTKQWLIGGGGGGLFSTSAAGGDKGAGTINAQNDIYKNDSAYTNPDYALEHYYTGTIEKYKDNPGADTYPGLLPLEELDAFMRDNHHLPRVQREDGAGIFERSDFVLEKLEEVFVHLVRLNDRIKKLEIH